MGWPLFLTGLNTIENALLINPIISIGLRPWKAGIGLGSFDQPFGSVFADTFSNQYGSLDLNTVSATAPLSVQIQSGVADISLNYDQNSLQVIDGKLKVLWAAASPVDEEGNPLAWQFLSPLTVDVDENAQQVSLHTDNTLELVGGNLSVKPHLGSGAIDVQDRVISLETDHTLSQSENVLSVNRRQVIAPLYEESEEILLGFDPQELFLDESNRLSVLPLEFAAPLARVGRSVSILHDPTLAVTAEGELGVNFLPPLAQDATGALNLAKVAPFTVTPTGELSIALHKSLKVEENLLKTNTTEVLKGFGCLYTSSAGPEFLEDIGLNPFSWFDELDLGALDDQFGDVDVQVLRMRTSDQFSQKNSRLSLVSPGYQRIPYWGVLYDTLSDPSFYYSETLSTLRVKNIELNTSTTLMNDSRAVWKGLLANYLKASDGPGGSAIAIGPEFNNQKSIGVLVDNKTIRINSINNELQSGLNFQQINGLKVVNENDVRLAVTGEKGVVFKNGNVLSGEGLTASNGVKRVGDSFELDLQAGENINIMGNTVSCTLKPDNSTIFDRAGMLTGKIVVAGVGCTVTDTPFSYIINVTPQLKTEKDTDQKENSDGEPLKETETPAGGNTVVNQGLTPLLVPPLIPIVPLPPPGVPPTPNPNGVVGLVGAIGGWAVLFGREREPQQVLDDSGSPVLDENGQPTYELGPGGNFGISSDENGCVQAFLDTPICFRGISFAFPETVINLDMLRMYDSQIIEPRTISIIEDLVSEPLTDLSTQIGQLEAGLSTKQASNRILTELSMFEPVQLATTTEKWLLFGSMGLDSKFHIDALQPSVFGFGNLAWKNQVNLASTDVTGILPAANLDTSVIATKTYVDSLGYLTAGTGLTKTGGTLSINAAQTQITSVGTLSALSVTGNVTSTAVPSASGHLTNKTYVDGLGYLTAGTGLTKTGGTLSVNAAQTGITSLGTLTGLTVNGDINITGYRRVRQSGGNSSGYTYGAFAGIGDGISQGYNAYHDNVNWIIGNAAGGTTRVTYGYSSITFFTGTDVNTPPTQEHFKINSLAGSKFSTQVAMLEDLTLSKNAVAATAPTLPGHLTNKTYVDSLGYLTVGTGLTKTGGTLSVNAAQTQITSVGTLDALTVTGNVTSSAAPVSGDSLTNKTYVDSRTWEYATQVTGKPTLGALAAKDTLDYSEVTNTPAAAEAGVGLTKTGTVFSVDASQTQITSVGTLSNLAATGSFSLTTAGSASGYSATFYQSGLANGGFLGQQTGVNSGVRNNVSMGFAYTSSGNSANNMFLGLGGAPKLRVTGLGDVVLESTSASTSPSTGALRVPGTGGVGIGGDLNVGGVVAATAGLSTNAGTSGSIHYTIKNGGSPRWGMGLTGAEGATANGSQFALWCFNNDGTPGPVYSPLQIRRSDGVTQLYGLQLTTNATATTAPTSGDHLANKTYVDGLAYLTAGTGLTKTGGTLSVNAAQTGITSVGTLTALTVTGNVTASAAPTVGGHLVNKSYVDTQVAAIPTILAGTGLTKTGGTLSVNAAQTQITSVGTLASLSVTGDVATNGAVYAGVNNYYHVRGSGSGIIWDSFNSGWICTDSSWVRSIAGKGIYTSGQVNAGSVYGYTIECGSKVTTNQLECTDTLFARGWMCKAGWSGAYNGVNKINFNWTGASVHVWIDDTLVGTMQTYSSKFAKKDIRNTSLAGLDMVREMRVVDFRYKDQGIFQDTGEKVGFVAEELKEISPHFVEEVGESISLNPMALIAVLTKAVQELSAEVEALKKKLK